MQDIKPFPVKYNDIKFTPVKTEEEKLAQEEANKKEEEENKGKKRSKAIMFGLDGSEMGNIHEIAKNDSIIVNARVKQRLVEMLKLKLCQF